MPNRTVRSHRKGLNSLHAYMHAPSKAVILQMILINIFISLTSSHRWTSPVPLQSARKWAWGEAPFRPAPPALQKDSSTLLRAPPYNGLQVSKGKPKNKAENIERSVRNISPQKTDRTVSYCIYGANFQEYGKNCSYRTVPYYRTPYRTPYCNSPNKD